MEQIVFKTSELLKFTRIVNLQKNQWIVVFKNWFMKQIRTHYWSNCLFLANRENGIESLKDMNVGELANALYSSNYPKILDAAKYEENKLNWWNGVVSEYERANGLYERLKSRGLFYRLTHCSMFKKAAKRLNEKDVSVTAVDVVEIALCRYIREGRGNYNTFIKFMK